MLAHFILKSASDTMRGRTRNPGAAIRPIDYDRHLDAAVGWLMRSIEVCDGSASSKGYRFMKGWMTPYPETSGYIIPTLFSLAREKVDPSYAIKAQAIGRWLTGVQRPDGGFSGYEVGIQQQPDVIDTGMILLGFNALIHEGHAEPFTRAGRAAAAFLASSMDDSGCFVRNMSHDIVHTYNVRAAWGLLAYGHLVGDEVFMQRAIACGLWTIAQQNEHGFYLQNNFKPGGNANTHGTAYVMRGLLQMHWLTDDDRFLQSVRRAADKVCALYAENGWIAAELGPEWQYLSSHICLTGYCQFAILLNRLFTMTGVASYRQTADSLIDDVCSYQDIASTGSPWHGAIAGSFPIYGRYAPLQYPNWATKFFIDALLARRFVEAGKTQWPELDRYGG